MLLSFSASKCPKCRRMIHCMVTTNNKWKLVWQRWCGGKSLFLVSPVPRFPTVCVNSHSHATRYPSRPDPTRLGLLEPLPGCVPPTHTDFSQDGGFLGQKGYPHPLQVCSQGGGCWDSVSRLNVYQGVSLASVDVNGKETQAAAQAEGQPWLTHESSPSLSGHSVLCSSVTLPVGWAARGGMTFGRKAQSLAVLITSQAAGTVHPWLRGIWECITVSTVWSLLCAALTSDHFLSKVFMWDSSPTWSQCIFPTLTLLKSLVTRMAKAKGTSLHAPVASLPTSAHNFPAHSVSPDCTICVSCPVSLAFPTLMLTFIYCKLKGSCL